MKVGFHPEARLEYREAATFYETARPGLGADFTRKVESVIEQIGGAPDRFPILQEDVRRCLVRRFPYAILYTPEEDSVLIVAVMHGSRAPDYWKHRLG